MNNELMLRIVAILLLLLAIPSNPEIGTGALHALKATAASPQADPARPWVHEFTPVRRLYVAPAGTGTGTLSNPMGLGAALESAQPGDLYLLRRGTYRGVFTVSRNGTKALPIVFRAHPGERATIEGGMQVEGAHFWIWDLEFTNPTKSDAVGINVLAPGVHLINNVIHDIKGGIAIGAWNTGPDQVVYGNILYNIGLASEAYNVYAQNDFTKNGYKYFVNNIFLDTPNYNLHVYTEKGAVTGFYIYRNVVRGSLMLIGGATHVEHTVLIENFFDQANLQFGYSKPAQVEFKDNYIVGGTVHARRHWGIGDGSGPQQARPNILTGNTILSPPGPHIAFRTATYIGGGGWEGTSRIPPADVFDRNTYSAPFAASFHANNVQIEAVDFNGWRSATASAGNAFDRNSRVVPLPTSDKVALLPNDYESGRAHLIAYKWSNSDTFTADLSAVIPLGARYSIYNVKSPFGPPVMTGTYNRPINIPVSGKFSAFLVIKQ